MRYIFILSMLFISVVALAKKEIKIDVKIILDNKGRSCNFIPKAWFEESTMELSTSCIGDGDVYEISLTDMYGVVIAQFGSIANGSLQSYTIPNMEHGQYYLYIITDKGSFIDEFKL